jgi:hypothetical protein
MISKYRNPKYYNAGLSNNIPTTLGDKYFGQDLSRDFRFLMDLVGLSFHDIVGALPVLLSGGVVTQGSGATLNITLGVGYAAFSADVVNSYASLPPTVQQLFVDAIRTAWEAQTNMNGSSADCSAYSVISDGVTVNYVKVAYLEKDGQTRTRQNLPGTYACEVIPWFTFTVNSTVPNADNHEICIAAFTASGGVYTFIPGDSHIAVTPLTLRKLTSENATIAGTKTFSSKITGDISGNCDGHSHGIAESGAGVGTLHYKLIAIGAWNMDADPYVILNSQITPFTRAKIRLLDAVIFGDDAGSNGPPSSICHGGYVEVNISNQLFIQRITGGLFDTAAFSSTTAPANRGYVVIGYID